MNLRIAGATESDTYMSAAYVVIPLVDCNTQFKHYGTHRELVPQSLKKNLLLTFFDKETKIPEMNVILKKKSQETQARSTTKEIESKTRKALGNQIPIQRGALGAGLLVHTDL